MLIYKCPTAVKRHTWEAERSERYIYKLKHISMNAEKNTTWNTHLNTSFLICVCVHLSLSPAGHEVARLWCLSPASLCRTPVSCPLRDNPSQRARQSDPAIAEDDDGPSVSPSAGGCHELPLAALPAEHPAVPTYTGAWGPTDSPHRWRPTIAHRESAQPWGEFLSSPPNKNNFPCWNLPSPFRYCGGTLVKEEPRGATSPSCQQRASTSVWLSWTASCTWLVERTRTMPVTRPSMLSAPSAGRTLF